MFRAVTGIVPWVGEPAQIELAIVPIEGSRHGGYIHLTRTSRLAFRLNADDVEKLLPLSDQRLVVEAATLRLGAPTEFRLRPVPGLASPFVVAEHHRHSDEVLEWLKAEFLTLDIRAVPTLRLKHGRESVSSTERNRRSFDCPFARYSRQIDDRAIVGWEVQVFGLAPEESLRLQERGIGPGRRHGCGVFMPVVGERPRPASRFGTTGVWFPQS
jgi:CRISPR-associated protein Cas6